MSIRTWWYYLIDADNPYDLIEDLRREVVATRQCSRDLLAERDMARNRLKGTEKMLRELRTAVDRDQEEQTRDTFNALEDVRIKAQGFLDSSPKSCPEPD